MDTASNCEAYMSRLFRKEKSSYPTPGIKPNVNNAKMKSAVNKFSSKPKSSGRTQNFHHNPVKNSGYNNSNIEGNINPHREASMENPGTNNLISKSAKPRSRSNAAGDREPWGKLLQNSSEDNYSKFSSFDPLRTLHFLVKELQYKLQSDLPDDNNMHQIVMDMQHALTRVPPEIASIIQLHYSTDTIAPRKSSSSNTILNSKKQDVEVRVTKVNQSSQTIHKFEDTELIQKIMEGSTLKLEASCRQMEMLCGRLKSEKEDLDEQLKIERDNVRFLKKRVGDLELQCEQLVSVTIKRLEEEKNELQLQVNRLTDVVDSQSTHANNELKNVTHELKQIQIKAEQECTKLRHQLALANMEKEKYIAILTVRDRQISEIRSEMSQLQDVVNEQLMDIHNNALADLPSTNSSETNNIWKRIEGEKTENYSNLSSVASDNQLASNHGGKLRYTSFQELPASESTGLSDDHQLNKKTSNNDTKNGVVNKQSIRNMFAELKKQAFAVTSMTLVKP
ncbi:hypothetical protein WA026_011280 [Henosepilachna vigintioctopunctata]|uniref:Uncharacterized protein n=1 Tax=Henosepilachna vigintioctopunctata TaxID=420089 RepID=A0AAW1UA28_9CUCU